MLELSHLTVSNAEAIALSSPVLEIERTRAEMSAFPWEACASGQAVRREQSPFGRFLARKKEGARGQCRFGIRLTCLARSTPRSGGWGFLCVTLSVRHPQEALNRELRA